MHHRVRPLGCEYRRYRFGIANVRLVEPVIGRVGDVPERVEIARIGQLVDIDDVGALADQQPDNGAADESGASGDQELAMPSESRIDQCERRRRTVLFGKNDGLDRDWPMDADRRIVEPDSSFMLGRNMARCTCTGPPFHLRASRNRARSPGARTAGSIRQPTVSCRPSGRRSAILAGYRPRRRKSHLATHAPICPVPQARPGNGVLEAHRACAERE